MLNPTQRKGRPHKITGTFSPLSGPFSNPFLFEDKDAANRTYAAKKILECNSSVGSWGEGLKRLIQQGDQAFGLDPPLLREVISIVSGEAIDWSAQSKDVDDVPFGHSFLDFRMPDGRDSLAPELPSGVRSKQALLWAARAHAGQSYDEISAGIYWNAKTVERAARLAASYVGIPLTQKTS